MVGYSGLKDVVQWPALREAYPDVMDTRTIVMPPGAADFMGGFAPGKEPSFMFQLDRIMDPYANPEARSVMPQDYSYKDLLDRGEPLVQSVGTHEIGHAIQGIENWDPGYSPDMARLQLDRPGSYLNTWFNKNFDQLPASPRGSERAVQAAAHDSYRRNSGETEARLGQAIARWRKDGGDDQLSPVFLMDKPWNHQLTIDDLDRGIFDASGVPGLTLSGPVRRLR
jgi:hypothetical protein